MCRPWVSECELHICKYIFKKEVRSTAFRPRISARTTSAGDQERDPRRSRKRFQLA